MDFGGFILFAILTLGLVVGSLPLATALHERSPRRWHVLRLWLGGVLLLLALGRHLIQVHCLDEPLFMAASRGDTAQVKSLLSAGASPNATWEDGTTALFVARVRGYKDIVIMLEKAGAIW